MTDTKIKAQGAKGDDAIAPQVQINATTNEWEISTDGGKNWKSLSGEKGYHVVRKSPKGKAIIFAGANGKVSLLKL